MKEEDEDAYISVKSIKKLWKNIVLRTTIIGGVVGIVLTFFAIYSGRFITKSGAISFLFSPAYFLCILIGDKPGEQATFCSFFLSFIVNGFIGIFSGVIVGILYKKCTIK